MAPADETTMNSYFLLSLESWANLLSMTSALKREGFTMVGPRTLAKLLLGVVDAKSSDNYTTSAHLKSHQKIKPFIEWIESQFITGADQKIISSLKPVESQDAHKTLLEKLSQTFNSHSKSPGQANQVACTPNGKIVIA